jgi:hypothetical protein
VHSQCTSSNDTRADAPGLNLSAGRDASLQYPLPVCMQMHGRCSTRYSACCWNPCQSRIDHAVPDLGAVLWAAAWSLLQGAAANFVETEQVVTIDGGRLLASHVQVGRAPWVCVYKGRNRGENIVK